MSKRIEQSNRSKQALSFASTPSATYKAGNRIGPYEVHGVLGEGGFGVVYLVYSASLKQVYALKTFKDEYVNDAHTREMFHKEAKIWVELESHPFIVRAHFVDDIEGRFYITLEYVAPNEAGLNTLEGYLEHSPPDLAQSLRWGIQFCHGMEYALSKGIRCHRDIKPANIMIGQDGSVKISDFGLAGILDSIKASGKLSANLLQGTAQLSRGTSEGAVFGTLSHMPPEQFINAGRCDERSDIYSFGIVLYEMAAGSLPFFPSNVPSIIGEEAIHSWFGKEMKTLHTEGTIPVIQTPLFPIIQRCLEKSPDNRYQSFQELREDLESLLKKETDETVEVPEPNEMNAYEWSNKGGSLSILGYYDEAIPNFDKAISLLPTDGGFWYNKGECLRTARKYEEAIQAYNEALKLNPKRDDAWYSKGLCQSTLKRNADALKSFDRALAIKPQDVAFWHNRGCSFFELGSHEEAIKCFDLALKHAPKLAPTWYCKGTSLLRLGRVAQALKCLTRATELAPDDNQAWYNKAQAEARLNRRQDAKRSFITFLELALPDDVEHIATAKTYIISN